MKNEENILKKYSALGLFPKYIDSFYEDKDYFLVESLIEGVNGDTFRAMPEHRFLKKNYNQTYLIFKKVIKNLLLSVDKMHKNNLFLGDISTNNVLINLKSNKVYFIDLGQTCSLSSPIEQKKIFYRTAGFYDQQTQYLSLKAQDNKQLGYLIMSLFSRANMFLKIDFTGKTSINFFKQYAEIYNIPSNFVNIAITLITRPNIEIDELIQNVTWNNVVKYNNTNLNTSYPSKLFLQLKKTVFTSEIDGINFNNGLNKESSFFIAEINLLKNPEQEATIFTDEFIKKVIDSSDKIVKNFRTMPNSELSLNKLLSLIFCLCYSVNEKNKTKILSKIDKLLDYIHRYYQVTKDDKIYYRMKPSSKFLSPYLYDGSAGILNILLILKDRYGINKYDNLIFILVRELSTELMPKCASFKRGLAGFVYVLLSYRKIYKDTSFDTSIKKMLNCLEFYTYRCGKNAYIIDTTFSKANINFVDGNEGILKVLKMAQDLYRIREGE